jgi:hypothetical protein
VAVNTVPHPGLAAERAVLDTGGTLLNISALPYAAADPLRDRDGRGTVVMNAGLVPGVTSLVAAHLVELYPDADAIELALTLSASATSGPAAGEFVYEHVTSRRRHRTAVVPFPAPIGERRCMEIAEDEHGWLGTTAHGRDVRTYLCLSERPLHAGVLAANRVGGLSLLPRAAFVRPRRGGGEPSRERFSEWVAVLRDRRRLAARTVEGDGDYRSTAAATVVLAEALRERPEALPRGCFDAEDLFRLGDVSAPLEAAGIRIVDRSSGPA